MAAHIRFSGDGAPLEFRFERLATGDYLDHADHALRAEPAEPWAELPADPSAEGAYALDLPTPPADFPDGGYVALIREAGGQNVGYVGVILVDGDDQRQAIPLASGVVADDPGNSATSLAVTPVRMAGLAHAYTGRELWIVDGPLRTVARPIAAHGFEAGAHTLAFAAGPGAELPAVPAPGTAFLIG